ncbi:MAG: hypothetical protein A2992_02570 [Elusimicrobia bacterium RIFCSPLOWO2_01_FULL_59_12]|nr:MAG: hypothetical protein A2992_02570 [Elusimicrobia bacterium RIFCSPLOWO2_01_FULL_59_12]
MLLQNYLRHGEDRLCALRGGLDAGLSQSGDLLSWIKRSFDFVLVLATPAWTDEYLALLDPADLLLLIPPTGRDAALEAAPHIDELARHAFPKALAHVAAEDARTLAHRLEREPEMYCDNRPLTARAAREAKGRIHERLLKASPSTNALPPEKTQVLLENLIAEEPALSVSREIRGRVLTDILHDVLGLGPLETLLKDPEVSEVMVNGAQTVFVEKKGRLYPADVTFESDAHLRTVIDRIVAPIGRRVDESTPLCDARLADGSRVNIVLPPLALEGPTLTIRKFMDQRLGLEDLIRFGALIPEMGRFLVCCVQARKNILISGGTGSGKTTLLNILSGCIAPDERIVTIEDAAELKLRQPHVVRLESRPPNAEGQGAIPIRRLVINALRMRPDRIVVGECRGGEALDMLQAMNTGHDGSLTTLHANTPRDALGRLEALVLMAGINLPVRVVREQIKSAVHVIVQMARCSDGTRKVTSITELTGMEGDVLTTAELYRYRSERFEATGLVSQTVTSC